MRLVEFHIDGFGRFQNLSITDLGPGLSIVLGRNEAGKSTLLAFLRSVLFGFPSRKQAEFYPPLNGGRHGGRLILVNGQTERITVERFAGKGRGLFTATLADGSQVGEEQFQQRIGAVTGDVYEKVFAFGLGELQAFENLKDDKIRDAIYGAGSGSGRHSPTEVVDKLEKQHKNLFLHGGTNPVMNKLLRQIELRRQSINERATDQQEYHRLQQKLSEADEAIAHLGRTLHDGRQRLARVNTLQQGWEDWITLNQCREQLQSLPRIESFPTDGVSRLDPLLNEQRAFRDQLSEARDEHQEAEQELAAVDVDETLLSLNGDIRSLERRVDLFEQRRQQLTAVQTERKLAEQHLDQNVRNLGDEWTEEQLRSFDLSIPAREELDAVRQACDEARKRVEKQVENVKLLDKLLQEKQELEKAERAKLEQLGGPAAGLDIEGIRQLQRHQASYEGARRDLPRVQQECRGNEDRLNDTLRSIGPDWNEGRLNRFDNSLAARERVSANRETLGRLRSQLDQSQHRVQGVRQLVQEHQDAVEHDEALLASMPDSNGADETSLTEYRGRLRALRSLLAQHAQFEKDRAHQEERLQDLEEQFSRLQHGVEGPAAGFPRWMAPVIALLGVLGLLVTGITRGEWVTGTIVLVTFLVLAVLLLIIQRNSPSASHARQGRRSQDQQAVAQRLAEVGSNVQKLRESERGLETEIQQQSESAGFGSPVDVRHVDQEEERLEQQLSLLQRRRPIEQRLEDNRSKLHRAKSALHDTERAQDKLAEELKQAQAVWRTWLSEAGLPETLAPELAIEVLSRLDSARELLKSIHRDRDRVRAMQAEVDRYEESVRLVVTNSEIDEVPQESLAAVQLLIDLLDEQEERSRSIKEARRRVDEAAQRTAGAQKLRDEAQQLQEAEIDKLKSVNERWLELLRRRGLRDTLTVDHAEQMLQGIERARGQLIEVDKQKANEKTLSMQIAGFVDEVVAVAKKTGLASPTVDEASTCVQALASRLQQAEEAQRRKDGLREKAQQSEVRIKRLEAQIEERQQEIRNLLAAAGTSDEETFRRQAADHDVFQSLSQQVHSLETRLRQLSGSDDAALAALEQELEQSTPHALGTEQQELAEEIERLDHEVGDTKELRGKLKLQLQQLENSDEISSLRMQEQTDLAEFREHAREWSVLKIAAHLIERAREKYERERRPAVLKQAERYFNRLTHGSYREILAPSGNDPSVVARDGSRKELFQLSRGTAEQLYLSLRFGFVEEFVERSEPLPLIFDEILVNFDPDRAAAAAEAIVELARSQQILLLTCHPTTVQLLKEICRNASVYELQDGTLKDGRLL